MRALARVRTNLISKFSPCGASLNYPTHPPSSIKLDLLRTPLPYYMNLKK